MAHPKGDAKGRPRCFSAPSVGLRGVGESTRQMILEKAYCTVEAREGDAVTSPVSEARSRFLGPLEAENIGDDVIRLAIRQYQIRHCRMGRAQERIE